ncbi:hypothetical protein MCOR27_008876 [Pyricularia oryzae]|uniref:AAA+ ATPase domain-containing protein n=1 Tax=Pyricularia grisea TaxID=148305 RepID=A0ABQ8NPT3_PYRGI|nr:hypothetical protein MCOR01_003982 [Pyricularia oryzae]KAI6300323.1 hypothetical protein MCOR33_003896 [Pyricularia grisea]KAI6258205.1 hypothetical protein MCOR19_005377 [Pyricularia oryzae]KAI6271298.1 hypothetical protein MCOR27_008876 [Pyricularia oryzae]KAI6275002.1 hypothetical protein MCOR26_006201 [Pyricularia oryzae]
MASEVSSCTLTNGDLTPEPSSPESPRPANSFVATPSTTIKKLWFDPAVMERSLAAQPRNQATSQEQATALAQNQANLISLLCLIAGSVLASSTNQDATTNDGPLRLESTPKNAAVPDPPVLVPEDDGRPSEVFRAPTAGTSKASDDEAIAKPDPKNAEASIEGPSPQTQCDCCAKKEKADEQAASVKSSATSIQIAPAADQTPESQTPAPQEASAKEAAVAVAEEVAKESPKASEGDGTSSGGGQTKPVDQSKPAAQIPTEEVGITNEILEEDPSKTGETASDGTSKTSEQDQSSDKPTAVGTAEQPAVMKESTETSEDVTPTTAEATTTETPKAEEATKTEPATTEEAKPTEPVADLKLPEWFLGNNVVFYEDLIKQPSSLELVGIKPPTKDDTKVKQTIANNASSDGDQKTISTSNDAASDQATAVEPPKNSKGIQPQENTCTCAHKIGEGEAEASQVPTSEAKPDHSPSQPAKPTFQLHRELYEEALDLITTPLQPLTIKEKADGTKVVPPRDWVTTSTFLFQSPKEGSLGFLDEVMHQLGRDTKADMITIDLEDLEDLCHHFWKDSDEVRNVSPMELTSITRLVGAFFGYSTPEEKSKKGVTCILNAAEAKRESMSKSGGSNGNASTANSTTAKTPEASSVANGVKQPLEANAVAVEILQKGVKDAFDSATLILQAAIAEAFARASTPDATSNNNKAQTQNSEAQSSNGQVQTENGANSSEPAKDAKSSTKHRPLIIVFRGVDCLGKMTPLQRLANGINDARRDEGRPIILIGTAVSNSTADNKPTDGISKVWDGLEIYESCIVNLAPRNTRRAAEALKQNSARAKPKNKWRVLRRSVRVTLDHHPSVSTAALYPSGPPSGEQVVNEVEDEERRQMLANWDDKLSERVVRQVSARAVKTGAVAPSDIFDVMQRVMRNKAIFDKMNDADDDEYVNEEGDSEECAVQVGGPAKKSKVKPLLESITASCSDAEKEYFECVVDTDAVSSDAQDIHMDQSLIDSLKQLLDLRQTKPYGILAKEAVNGAILYGPPGTGKTHLARVVAASAGTNLIVATPADIQNMWVGETEKRIKALFSLGVKLAPCVIFLDEGDSVFGKRSGLDHDWQRKAMSQFLMEMDGLVSRKKAPFLMVATNRPGDIDDAVCRRLPHSLHIGMPTAAGRRAILDIYLKDEKLDAALDLEEVASDRMTKGFSGSDIRTLCVQAAMVAHKELMAERRKKDGEGEEDAAGGSQKRVITLEHFKKALERTRPSVTRESLMEIERFTGQNEQGDHQAMYI